MNSYFVIKLLSFLIHAALGLYTLGKNPRRRINQVFSLTVLSIAAMELGYSTLLISSRGEIWMRVALIGQCLIPGNIVLFSLIYGRTEYRDSLRKWKFYLIAIYLFSLGFIGATLSGILKITFSNALPNGLGASVPGELKDLLLFNRIGFFLNIFFLICILVTIANLENSYRNMEINRRRTRYPAIVFIGMLSFHILIYSLALGFSYVKIEVLSIASITLMAANICMAYSVIRPEPMGPRIYVGRGVIAKSYTLLLAGIYLLIIGMLGKIIQIIGRNVNFFLAFLVAFLILLIFIVALLSRSLKRRVQALVERNFYRQKYDYRREWEKFNRKVFSILSLEKLLQGILDAVSEAIGTESISMMVLDERRGGFYTFALQDKSETNEEGQSVPPSISIQDKFVEWLWRYGTPVKIDNGKCNPSRAFNEPPDIPSALITIMESGSNNPASSTKRLVSGVCVPIIAERRLIAIMILGQRRKALYSQEDLDLMETMASQISIAIMSARKSQELSLARELESFNRLSAMLLHDLKSSASMLSLVVQNAADNFGNPEFQKDALSTMSSAVDRIQKLILRLSAAPGKTEFQPALQLVDLTDIINGAVARSGVRDLVRIGFVEELGTIPKLMLDPENIERVILNLLLNAIEAIDDEGSITIKTCQTPDGYVQFSISDTGCGMSQEFIRERLFQPFQTTKERGLGIGLYQCKAIVDTCGGFIEIQSRQGMGSTFVVQIPIPPVQESFQSKSIAPSMPHKEEARN